MWTPRRVLLLLGSLLLFGGVFGVYNRLLGWLDGLPQLPARFLDSPREQPVPPPRLTSPTVLRLIEAFGPNCPESQDNKVYETKLEFRQGESSVVVACGPPPANPNSKRVTLAPFSVAVFGKPRPPQFRQPGEVVEISTLHADKAVLEFDQEIKNPNDMNKAKLLRIELVSDPDQALPDPRRGRVHMTRNQRSADPNKFIVMRTQGPVFYRDPKGVDVKANPGSAEGPDIWTDAAVEVVDRQNLPRPYGAAAPRTAAADGDEMREPGAAGDVLAGRRLPPPTVTAVGMRIFLDRTPPKEPRPLPTKQEAEFGSIRRVELLEKVLIHLWTDARQAGFAGSDPKPPGAPTTAAPKGASPLAVLEPPPAAGAVVGGLFFAVQHARQANRALVQIDTLGPFAFDAEKNLARFDVLPRANPALPNDVQVTRVLPDDSREQLLAQVLELEFDGPPTSGKPAPLSITSSPPTPSLDPAAGGPTFKRVHAWAYSPGRTITLLRTDKLKRDDLAAYGHDLVHEHVAERTVLTGSPLYAVRTNPPSADPTNKKPTGQHILEAGGPQQPASLVIAPGPAPDKLTTLSILGPGKLELFDPSSGGRTIHATWLTSLTHTKETGKLSDRDLFTFTDGASFADVKADYWLRGTVLKLWLERSNEYGVGPEPAGPAAVGPGSGSVPHRLQAIGTVSAHSADFDIEQADHLNVMFREGFLPPAPPKPAAAAPPPAPPKPSAPAVPGVTPPAAPPANQPPPEPAKPKPPMRLKARVIDTWVVRYNAPPDPKAGPPKPADPARPGEVRPGEGSTRYDLEKARCEDNVEVHQDPTSPDKSRGIEIRGRVLLVDNTPDGSVMTVTGTDAVPGQVHYENMSILGPKVVIDQLHNFAAVEGRGDLLMPANSDFAGSELKQPEMMVIHWRDRMVFSGAKKIAEFTGNVSAEQGESWLQCHNMVVTLDRPVYFNQLRKPGETGPAARPVPAPAADPKAVAAKGADNPKVETVRCYPAPADAVEDPIALTVRFNQVERDPKTGRVLKAQLLTAREVAVNAVAQDEGRPEKYQTVVAHGPGVVRMWQPGQKDMVGLDAKPAVPMPAGKDKPKDAEGEMKLTEVRFATRMVVKDKGKVYQEATFFDNVEVTSIPADRPEVPVDKYRLPPGSIRLTCARQLVVTSHRQGENPPVQTMRADENAFIRSDEYDGWGDVITFDGRLGLVTLHAGQNALARIQSRVNGNDQPGKEIIYDRQTGGYKVNGGFGGTIQPGGGGLPKMK